MIVCNKNLSEKLITSNCFKFFKKFLKKFQKNKKNFSKKNLKIFKKI